MGKEFTKTQLIELEKSGASEMRKLRDEERYEKSLNRIKSLTDDCSAHTHKKLVEHVVMMSERQQDTTVEVDTMKGNIGRILDGVNNLTEMVAEGSNNDGETIPIYGKQIHVRYVFATVVCIAVLITFTVIWAMQHNKLDKLAKAVSIARGTAVQTNTVRVVNMP